jgi:hypothetical protein
MAMRAGTLVATVVFVAGMLGRSAVAGDVPWKRIPDARNLKPEERDVAARAISTAACYGGCAGTILDCLNRNDPTGMRLANFVARRAAAGADFDRLMTAVDKRPSPPSADTMRRLAARLHPAINAPVRS